MIIRPKKKWKPKTGNSKNYKSVHGTYGIDDDLIVKTQKFKVNPNKSVYKPSKGESHIRDFLLKHGIKFVREKGFSGLINPMTQAPLRMDFWLYEHKICIEFDGKQHFKFCKRFHKTNQEFRNAQSKDNIKNMYCRNNGIRMIRISFKQINEVTQILFKELIQSNHELPNNH